MALDVALNLKKTDLLYQEDTLLTFVLTNAGDRPLAIRNPQLEQFNLRLRVLNLKTGVATLYQKPLPPGVPPLDEEPLAPRASIDAAVTLLWLAPLEPADYEVSAIYLYNQEKEQAESAPLKVKVRATTPANLAIDSVQPSVVYAFWVNLGGDSPELVRTRLDGIPGGGVKELLRIGPAGLQTVVVPSRGPNGTVTKTHWVAWLEGRTLKYLHVDKNLGPSALKSVPLPLKEASLVAPLMSAQQKSTSVRPAGAALLWAGDRDQKLSQLLSIPLSPDGAGQAAKADLPGPAPVWLAAVLRSDKKKLALIVQESAGKLSLGETPWPDTPGPLRPLGLWKGVFLAGAATLGFDDFLHGSLLLRTGEELWRDLERIDFEIDPKGAFSEKSSGPLAGDPADPFVRGLLRVSARGVRAALLQTHMGLRFLDAGKGPSPLPGALSTTKYPIDLIFQSEQEPLLVVGGRDAGLKLLRADGSPLPDPH